MKGRTVILKALLVAAWGTMAIFPAAGAELRKEDVVVRRLENGLKILLVENHEKPEVAYITFFKAGLRTEERGLSGVTHFIEHLMFQGTPKYARGEFDRIVKANGGEVNATTNTEMTLFFNSVPSSAIEKIIEIEADRMQGLTFDPKVVEWERNIILMERRLRDESDLSLLLEKIMANALPGQAAGRSLFGQKEDIIRLRLEDIIRYYHTFYTPNNTLIIAVGDFSVPNILGLIQKYYASIPSSRKPLPASPVEAPATNAGGDIIRMEGKAPILIIAYPAPSVLDPDFPAYDYISQILAGGKNSRLYRRLAIENSWADSVTKTVPMSIESDLLTIVVQCKNNAGLEPSERLLREEMSRTSDMFVSESDLESAKKYAQARWINQTKTNMSQAFALGQAEIFFGSFERLFEVKEKAAALTPADLQAVFRKYFSKPSTTGILTAKANVLEKETHLAREDTIKAESKTQRQETPPLKVKPRGDQIVTEVKIDPEIIRKAFETLQNTPIGTLDAGERARLEDVMVNVIILENALDRFRIPDIKPLTVEETPPVKGHKGRFKEFTGRITLKQHPESKDLAIYQFETLQDVVRQFQGGGGLAFEMYFTRQTIDSPLKELIWAKEGIDIPNGHKSIHRYKGNCEMNSGLTFDGDEQYPLTFVMLYPLGYVYVCGKGTVTLPNGTKQVFQ